jgi:hypothetical protein
MYKNAAKRPDANEGGREEEERPGIAAEPDRLRRLRNNETVFVSARLGNTQRLADAGMSPFALLEFPELAKLQT